MPKLLRAFLAPAFLFLSFLTATALEVTLTPNDPIVKISFPTGWSVTEIKRGIEVRSPDQEVFLWFEIYAPSEYAALVKEHETYFRRQGVVITGEARVISESSDSFALKASDFPATWKGAPTVLRYLAYDLRLPSAKQILLSYWASPKGDKAHDAATKGILESMKAAK